MPKLEPRVTAKAKDLIEENLQSNKVQMMASLLEDEQREIKIHVKTIESMKARKVKILEATDIDELQLCRRGMCERQF